MKNETSLKLRAIIESAFLAKTHAAAFKSARDKADREGLPKLELIEITTFAMANLILDDYSPMDKDEKRMLVNAAFRKLTCEILSKIPQLLTTPLDSSEKEKEVAKKDYYYSKEADDGKRAD